MRTMIAAATVSLLVASHVSADGRELTESLPASSLDRLELKTGNGTVTVRPSDDDEVRVFLSLRPRRGGGSNDRGVLGWFLSSPRDQHEMIESVELSTSVKNGRVVVRPLPRGSARADQVTERWLVEVPRRFAVDVEANSSTVTISGVQGGVRVRQGHGKTSVDVPRGAVDIALHVGDVEAEVGGAQDAEVDARSQVGDTKVWLNDRRVKVRKPPGPGSSFRLDGGAGQHVAVRVSVGNVRLRLSD